MSAEWILYIVFGALALGCAFGVVFAPNPVHSALYLVATLLSIAILFLAQSAYFLSAVQIIVYTGAIMVLFLFVIMLLGIDSPDPDETDRLRNPGTVVLVAGVVVVFFLLVQLAVGFAWPTGVPGTSGSAEAQAAAGGNVQAISAVLFTKFLLPFELTSFLLVAGVIGAVVLARRGRGVFGAGIGRSREVVEELRRLGEAETEAAAGSDGDGGPEADEDPGDGRAQPVGVAAEEER